MGPSRNNVSNALSNRKRFRVCIAWYKHERGWENSRQLCKPETNSRVPVENSPNPSSVNIRLCKRRKKVFYCFYNITFPRKMQNCSVWHWLKEKFLPVAKSCARSLARVISSCFAKDAIQSTDFSRLNCQLKRKKIDTPGLLCNVFPSFSRRRNG